MNNKDINKQNEEAMKANNAELNRNARNTDFYTDNAINNDKPLEEHDIREKGKEKTDAAKNLSGQE